MAEIAPRDESEPLETEPAPEVAEAQLLPLAKRHEEIEYSEESIPQATRARLGWLALFLVGLWGAAFVVNSFDEMVQKDVELAYFVPLIIGHGGNAGSQSVSSVIRALATKDISAASVRSGGHVVVKETAVGALCGFALGGAILCVHELMPALISHDVGVIVAISIPLVSIWANFMGAVLPLLAAHLGSNPALTSAPLMTTIIDASGLVIYFLGTRQLCEWKV